MTKGLNMMTSSERIQCDQELEKYKKILEKVRECGSLEAAARHPDAPEWAYWFAANIVDGRWPEAEPAISKSNTWQYWYVREVLHNPDMQLAATSAS